MFDISGSLHFRDKGPVEGDRKLVMAVGVIAVPERCAIPYEHLCQVSGSDLGNGMDLIVGMDPKHVVTVPECFGFTANQLLTSPIWRIAPASR